MAAGFTGLMIVLMVIIEEDLSVLHVVLMSQQKCKNGGDIFLGETVSSAVLDSDASSTVCGTLMDVQKKKIVKIKGMRTFKFGNGNKMTSLYKVILPCVITNTEFSIITDVMNSDIPLLLSKKGGNLPQF